MGTIGRPPAGKNKRERLPVRIERQWIAKLEILAAAEGVPRGKLAGDMLEGAIKRATLPKSLV